MHLTQEKLQEQNKDLKTQNDKLNSTIFALKSEISAKKTKITILKNNNKDFLTEKSIKKSFGSLFDKTEDEKKRFSDFAKQIRKEKTEL